MAYLTRDEVLEYSPRTRKGRMAASWRVFVRTGLTPSVFLCHSHADKDIIEPVANFLASLGVSLYIDWLDPEMPSITSLHTVRRIRDRIKANHRFLVLATKRSLESHWVPWELGYADGGKAASDIAILPISEFPYQSVSTEYMQVYQRIEAINGVWYIMLPGHNRSTTTIRDWLLASRR